MGGRRGIWKRALPVRGQEGGGNGVTRAPALELVQERPMDGTPQALVADGMAPLKHDRRQQAAAARVGG